MDGFDGAQGQQRGQRKRQIGGTPHFFGGHRHQRRQALAAHVLRGAQAHPAAVAELVVGVGKAFGGGHLVVFPGVALVAVAVDRGEHPFGKLGGFVQNGVHQLDIAIFVAGQGAHRRQLGQFRQHKTDVLERDLIGHAYSSAM